MTFWEERGHCVSKSSSLYLLSIVMNCCNAIGWFWTIESSFWRNEQFLPIFGIPKVVFYWILFSQNPIMNKENPERTILEYSNTKILEDYPVSQIRIVQVPHMSSFLPESQPVQEVHNVRTYVGISGEE